MENCCSDRQTIRSEEEKKALITRVNRILGQLNGVKKMVEEDRYCDDILIQLAAVDKAVKSLAAVILERHMHTCLIEHLERGEDVIDELVELFKRFQ